MCYHVEKRVVTCFYEGKWTQEERFVLRTCSCTLLINGLEYSHLRTIPKDLELLGQGYAIVLGYNPDSVHVFQSEKCEYIINVLSFNKYEYPPRVFLEERTVNISLIDKLVRELDYRKTWDKLSVAIVYNLDRSCTIGVVDDYNLDALFYKIVGLIYRSRSMLEHVLVVTDAPVDASLLGYLTVSRVVGVVTTSYVTCDAAEYAQKVGITLLGEYAPDMDKGRFVLYSLGLLKLA